MVDVQAIVQKSYGSPAEVLTLADIDKPKPSKDQVLVAVRATSIHVGDCHVMRGVPYVMRPAFGIRGPRNPVPGTDFAGTVTEVGAGVTDFEPGDDVFGWGTGTCADFASVKAAHLLPKPNELGFEEAAAIGVSAQTALQAVRDKAKVQQGQRVLINGASGGVGTFAVQIAKSLGADVTAVCSTGNVEFVSSLGADHVVDYTQQNFTEGPERYDRILDIVGNHSFAAIRRVLTTDGTALPVGAPVEGWFGGVDHALGALAQSIISRRQLRPFVSLNNLETLTALRDLATAGTITPAVSRTYPMVESADAFAHVVQGHARGKIVIVNGAHGM